MTLQYYIKITLFLSIRHKLHPLLLEQSTIIIVLLIREIFDVLPTNVITLAGVWCSSNDAVSHWGSQWLWCPALVRPQTIVSAPLYSTALTDNKEILFGADHWHWWWVLMRGGGWGAGPAPRAVTWGWGGCVRWGHCREESAMTWTASSATVRYWSVTQVYIIIIVVSQVVKCGLIKQFKTTVDENGKFNYYSSDMRPVPPGLFSESLNYLLRFSCC